jgi:ABC-type multidrug transport system ATPase subunit
MKLEFDSIEFKYTTDTPLLSSVYAKCETGKITGLLGRNGAGKSTLLKLVFGSLKSEIKSVRVNDQYIPHPAFSNRVISYLPQESFIPAYLTLYETLRLYKIEIDLVLTYFPELKDDLNKKRDHLAGGIARLFENLLVLFSPSPFCFFDEPFTGLSPVMIERLISCMVQEKHHKGILITDHLYKHVLGVSDDLYVLLNGRTYFMKSEEDLIRRGYLADLE